MDENDLGQVSKKFPAKFMAAERTRILGRIKPDSSPSPKENKIRSNGILGKNGTENSILPEKQIKKANSVDMKRNKERRNRMQIPVRNIFKNEKAIIESLKDRNKKEDEDSEIQHMAISDKNTEVGSLRNMNRIHQQKNMVKNISISKNVESTSKIQDRKILNLSSNVNHKARRKNISPNEFLKNVEIDIDETPETNIKIKENILDTNMVRKPFLEHNARLGMKFRIKFPTKNIDVQETIKEDKEEKLAPPEKTKSFKASTFASVQMNDKGENVNVNENIPTFDLEKALTHAELTWAQDPFRKISNNIGRPLFNIDFSKNPGKNTFLPALKKSFLSDQLVKVSSKTNMKVNGGRDPLPVPSQGSNKEEVISIESLTWTPALLQDNFDIGQLKQDDTRPTDIFAHFSS